MRNGYGNCVPCMRRGTQGLGEIVFQPLSGAGLGQTEELALQFGAAGPLALMAGAAVSYGTITGLASRDWAAAGTGALLGSGMVGLLAGGTMSAGVGVAAGDTEARSATLSAGLPAALVGTGLLIWGGVRALQG